MNPADGDVPLWSLLRSRNEFDATDLPLLTVVSQTGVHVRDLRDGRAPSEDLAGYRVVEAGDLVVNKLWARFGAYGVSPVRGIISPAYWVLRIASTDVSPPFLHYLLRSQPYRAEIARRSKDLPPNGFDLSWDQFRRIAIRPPSIGAQRRIADFLDTETARIDALNAKKRRMIELAREGEFAFISRRAVPPAARMARLGRLSEIRSGITVDAARRGSLSRPYLRVANVQPGWIRLDEVKEIAVDPDIARRYALRDGDVLMTEGGDLDKLGRGAVWHAQIPNCLHQNHVFALRPHVDRLRPEYLELLTATSHARAYFERTGSKTTNLASTNAAKVAGLPVPVLTLQEQDRIIAACQVVRTRTRVLTETLGRQTELLQERRQALITAAVTGQLPVTA